LQHTYVYEFFKDFTAPVVALVGITVTGTVATLGLQSFEKFKREKIEERRIEVSIDALALAYEAKYVFESIRARARSNDEDDGGVIVEGNVQVKLRDGQRAAYVVLKRLRTHEDFFESAYRLQPRFMAVFGADTDKIFHLLYDARTTLQTTATVLFEHEALELDRDDVQGKEDRRRFRDVIFRGPTEEKIGDAISDKLDDFRIKIEGICRPVIDHQYRKHL
jgi:hypothetical protein